MLMRILNTPFTILLAPDGTYYLFAGDDSWYVSEELTHFLGSYLGSEEDFQVKQYELLLNIQVATK